MRKSFVILMIIFLMVGLVGCSTNQPELVIKEYCNTLKSYDLEKLETYMVDNTDKVNVDLETDDIFGKSIFSFLEDCASDLKYTIGAVTVNNDTATVSVTFKYLDATLLTQSVIGEYMKQAFALAFSGADESTMEGIFSTIFEEKKEEIELSESTEIVMFNCVKVADKWKIDNFSISDSEKLTNIMTCNMNKVFSSLGNEDVNSTSNEVANSNYNEVEEELVYIDIPKGKNVELATLNMRVKDSNETNKLVGKYVEDKVAQEGTKFMVIEFEVENTTSSIIDYSHQLRLYDEKGREYSNYSDAFWYFDETFMNVELQPNIPVVGYLIYNVPKDSKGCYMVVGKAGTNESYKLFID